MNFPIKPSEIEALAALARAPATQKAVADAHAREVAERTARVTRIKSLDQNASRDWPLSQAAIAKAIAAREKAIRALRESDAELAKANAESVNQSMEYTRSRQEEEAALIERADIATIDAFKSACLNELDALGKPSVIVTSTMTTRSEVTRKPIRNGFSNVASIVARMAAVRAAYHDSDLLKLEPDQRKLPTIIAEIRASWPIVDTNPQPKV